MSNDSSKTENSKMSQVAEVVENAAITAYKHKLDAKMPIRERDLQHPSRASLVGCVWTKFMLGLIVTLFLIGHTMGLDGSTPMANPLSAKMLLTDICVGCGMFGLVSVFTYFYVRVKNQGVGILLFLALLALAAICFLIWEQFAEAGGLLVFPIIVIIVCLIPFVMDIWGLIKYDTLDQH
ncbi:MAG: hypothetical protein ACOYIK_01675 [Coriobacteriales bacterium]|jgi:hypothetical protein